MGPLRSFTPMVAFAMLSPAISIHLGQSAVAFPALPHLLAPAVSEADVILTGTFLSVPPAAPDARGGGGFAMTCAAGGVRGTGEFEVDKVLKGTVTGPRVLVDMACGSSQLVGVYLLVFLNTAAAGFVLEKRMAFAPAIPGVELRNLSPHDAVVAELAAITVSPAAVPGDKISALELLRTDHTPAASQALRRAMSELAGSARTDALAALISQGDPAALAPA